MTKVSTHLHFAGQCIEAFKYYEKCLGAKMNFSMTWGDSPSAKEVPENWQKKIIHASIEVDGQIISGDDAPPNYYSKPQGFSVTLTFKDVKKAEEIFKALSDKGQVRMPFSKTFWSPGFGMTVDQFGIPWMINCAE